MHKPLPPSRDPLLFTPGPLTTSLAVKQAMLHDVGSWHQQFNSLVSRIRDQLLTLAGVARADGYEAILLQGSGTFGVEAVFSSAVPEKGKVLIISNGAYGERMVRIAERLKLAHEVQRYPENVLPDPALAREALWRDGSITHLALVHCETTTGILNPIEGFAELVRLLGCSLIVDAMSSFGGLPISLQNLGADFLVSSPNKCLEGVPGFSFVLARRAALLAADGAARSLSLDLLDQLRGFDKNGQFRFTPPTHSILAFARALEELEQEGGVLARSARYRRNHRTLLDGMRQLGFKPYLDPAVQSPIITAFHYPESPEFIFDAFYHGLSDRGFIIYPGKLTEVDTFRIGSIGRITHIDMQALLAAVRDVLDELGVVTPPCLEPLAEVADDNLNPKMQ